MRTKKPIVPFIFSEKGKKPHGIIFDFIESFSELIFCSGCIPGLLFAFLIAFCDLNIAGAALVSIITLQLFIKIVGINWEKYRASYLIYNPILVGMSIGVIFKLSASLILVISIATVLTFVLTISMAEYFKTMHIPILSLPFAIVSTAFYLASTSYSKLFSLAFYNIKLFVEYEKYLPMTVNAFLKAFGSIIFMPNILVGGAIFLVIIIRSRILALHAIASFFTGVFIHSLMISSFEQALLNPYTFNYILVGLALGGIFLIPSIKSSIICLLAVGVSVILVDVTGGFAQIFRIPVFTLPFNFSVILFIYALRAVSYSDINNEVRFTPEDSLAANKIFRQRFKPNEISIGLPMLVPLTIYQGHNGSWTHKDKWRYAFDFVITDKDGHYGTEDDKLQNYYIFGKEIISPATGYVVSCCDTFPDNPIGKVDHFNNWGNFIILRTSAGWFVEISHLMFGSLIFKHGDYVELGQVVGKCGNSGYSPIPHIHIQVQKTGFLGDETVPFNLAIYKKEEQVFCAGKPEKDDVIEPLGYNYDIVKSLNLNLATMHKYELFENEKKTGELIFHVKRDPGNAELFLEDLVGSRLYFAYANGAFYFYDFIGKNSSLLKMIFMALPRLPLVYNDKFTWEDSLPPSLTGSWSERILFPLKAWISPNIKCVKGIWNYNKGQITGTINKGKKEIGTRLVLDPLKGIEEIKIGKLELKRSS